MQTQGKAAAGGILAALIAFLPLFKLFDRLLIAYWEWQHAGRRMKFTLWADDRAFLLTLFLCAVVFYVTIRYLQRHQPADQQIKRRSLVIAAALGVIVVYLTMVACLSMVVSRFSG